MKQRQKQEKDINLRKIKLDDYIIYKKEQFDEELVRFKKMLIITSSNSIIKNHKYL